MLSNIEIWPRRTPESCKEIEMTLPDLRRLMLEMIIIKPPVLFLTFVAVARTLQNSLVSAPFDNFRIECAKSTGAVRIGARMIGSQGFVRQDIVFAVACERVGELYPWHNIPTGIRELEREDCYYSHLFDPIVDTESLYTCQSREYISGITRLSDTRIQVLCCRLRTRDEANCREKEFPKPIGSDPRTEIYHYRQLINSISIEGNNYRVRFCDLIPRAIDVIYNDLPVPDTTTTRIPNNGGNHASETENSELNATTAVRTQTHTTNGPVISQVTTVPSATKYTVQIFQPNSLHNFEDHETRTVSTSPPAMSNHSQDIRSSMELQPTSGGKFPGVIDKVVKEKNKSTTEWITNRASKQNSALLTVYSVPKSAAQNRSAAPNQAVTSRYRTRTTTTISSLTSTTTASLILLKPLSSKSQYTKATSRNKQSAKKASVRRRIKQMLNSTISTTPFITMPQPKATSNRPKQLEHAENRSPSSNQSYRNFPTVAHVDEEIKYPSYENRDNNTSLDNETSGSHPMPTDRVDITEQDNSFSYGILSEIRRAPIKSLRKHVGAAYGEFKGFPNKQTNKVDHEFNFLSFGDENIDGGTEYSEYDLPMKKSADGSRTYVPENHEPLNAPSAAIVYDASKQDNISGSAERNGKVQQIIQGNGQLRDDVSKELLLPMNDDDKINFVATDVYTSSSMKPTSTVSKKQDDLKLLSANFTETGKTAENVYNPAKFYRTPPPKRRNQREKVLTFCTKEIAIRDRYNLVIACGSETEIWQPFRCPEGSECFSSADSTYRICCAVAEAVRYAQKLKQYRHNAETDFRVSKAQVSNSLKSGIKS
ncbi:unnamed protein product [Litomosoides sigmodontis]|uniref:Uncharacterized protein n=1 Tax=Litomosoides sigmodontis TaxID=42156 RepID=A0A3P6U349_LITSI|nr:unnamed protein product [Litomosoides sigmodontis]